MSVNARSARSGLMPLYSFIIILAGVCAIEARGEEKLTDTPVSMLKASATTPVTAGKQAPREVAFPGGPAWGGRSISAKPDGTWERLITQAEGAGEGATQVCVTESADMGATWSKPKVLGTIGGSGFGGTAAIVTPKGEVHLFMTKTRWVGEGKAPAINRFIDVWYTKSSNGRTEWTNPRAVFEGYVGALCNGAYLKSGRMILPFAMMIGGRAAGPPIGRNETIVLYSDDDGETWPMAPARLVAPVEPNYNGSSEGACEPSVVQLKDGRVWMLMRTQTGFLYESWSNDGVAWSDAKPSQFHASTGPPYLIRLKDDRIALFWNNCEMPPRVDGDGVYGGRDALHAAIGDPEAKHFTGFREIYLDPTRHTTPPKSGDRGTAYPDAVLTADGRIGVSSGQGGRRAVMIVDPAWLMETSRASDFSDGLASWCAYKGFGKATGWWRDRVQGAQLVDHPGKAGAKVLHVRRPDEKDPDGATWNFPMGRSGKLVARVMMKEGSLGGNLALADRFFDPCDTTCDAKALFLFPIDRLKPGVWHEIVLQWDVGTRTCRVTIDGSESPSLTMAHDTPTGVSYVRFRSTAPESDSAGFVVESVRADVQP
jgi:hypothetical protein